MRLHYEVQGQGFPLIILHGLFGSLDNWRTQSKQLGLFFTVYALDLRNHGSSPHSDIIDYPAMAEDLREFLEMHEIDSAFVLGHSMGGKVAMQFATSYPERVDKLVVVDIAPRGYPLEHEEIFKALFALNLRIFTHVQKSIQHWKKAYPTSECDSFYLKTFSTIIAASSGGCILRLSTKTTMRSASR
jgi:esterase